MKPSVINYYITYVCCPNKVSHKFWIIFVHATIYSGRTKTRKRIKTNHLNSTAQSRMRNSLESLKDWAPGTFNLMQIVITSAKRLAVGSRGHLARFIITTHVHTYTHTHTLQAVFCYCKYILTTELSVLQPDPITNEAWISISLARFTDRESTLLVKWLITKVGQSSDVSFCGLFWRMMCSRRRRCTRSVLWPESWIVIRSRGH